MVAEAVALDDAPDEAETLESLLSTRTFDPSSFSVPIAVVTSDGGPELPSILPRQLLPTPSPSTIRTARTSYFSFSRYRVSRVSGSPTIRTAYNCPTRTRACTCTRSLARSLPGVLGFPRRTRPRCTSTVSRKVQSRCLRERAHHEERRERGEGARGRKKE